MLLGRHSSTGGGSQVVHMATAVRVTSLQGTSTRGMPRMAAVKAAAPAVQAFMGAPRQAAAGIRNFRVLVLAAAAAAAVATNPAVPVTQAAMAVDTMAAVTMAAAAVAAMTAACPVDPAPKL